MSLRDQEHQPHVLEREAQSHGGVVLIQGPDTFSRPGLLPSIQGDEQNPLRILDWTTASDEEIVAAIVATNGFGSNTVGFYRETQVEIPYVVEGLRRTARDRFRGPRTYVMDGTITTTFSLGANKKPVIRYKGELYDFDPDNGDKVILPSDVGLPSA